MTLPPPPSPSPFFLILVLVVHWRSTGCLLSPFNHLFAFLSFCLFVFLPQLFFNGSSQFILIHGNSSGSLLSSVYCLFFFVFLPSQSFRLFAFCLFVFCLFVFISLCPWRPSESFILSFVFCLSVFSSFFPSLSLIVHLSSYEFILVYWNSPGSLLSPYIILLSFFHCVFLGQGRVRLPNRMNFQKSANGGEGSFSIQKFMVQLLGNLNRAFSS